MIFYQKKSWVRIKSLSSTSAAERVASWETDSRWFCKREEDDVEENDWCWIEEEYPSWTWMCLASVPFIWLSSLLLFFWVFLLLFMNLPIPLPLPLSPPLSIFCFVYKNRIFFVFFLGDFEKCTLFKLRGTIQNLPVQESEGPGTIWIFNRHRTSWCDTSW